MNDQAFLKKLYQCIPLTHSKKTEHYFVTEEMDTSLGSPSKCYPIVHVAGTNGKGSVVGKIAKALSFSGYRVGVFTSPHLYSIRERIAINEDKISEEDFTRYGEKIFSKMQELQLSMHFFEILTCMALEYFAKQRVDLVVLETGIGGLKDSTNFVTPLLSVITSISEDHADLLGSSLEEIAFQKAGIIKNSIPVVLGPRAQFTIIEEVAKKKNASVLRTEYTGVYFDEENSVIAKEALHYLNTYFSITEENISLGLQYKPSCRFEVYPQTSFKNIHTPEYVIFDVAHNPDGFERLIEAIHCKLGKKQLRFIIGMSKDKEIKKNLEVLIRQASYIHISPVEHFKLLKAVDLKEAVLALGFTRCSCEESIEQTLRLAFQEAFKADEILVVCGSFYMMDPIKQVLGKYYHVE
jgi:dihydrofolate synthase/folylpolyglutamate synthase